MPDQDQIDAPDFLTGREDAPDVAGSPADQPDAQSDAPVEEAPAVEGPPDKEVRLSDDYTTVDEDGNDEHPDEVLVSVPELDESITLTSSAVSVPAHVAEALATSPAVEVVEDSD